MGRLVYEFTVRFELVQPEEAADKWGVDELRNELRGRLKDWADKVDGELRDLDIVID